LLRYEVRRKTAALLKLSPLHSSIKANMQYR
jgi:hypothetical protein